MKSKEIPIKTNSSESITVIKVLRTPNKPQYPAVIKNKAMIIYSISINCFMCKYTKYNYFKTNYLNKIKKEIIKPNNAIDSVRAKPNIA